VPAKMEAADAMRRALWLDDLPDFEPLATSLATNAQAETGDDAVTSDSVGRPGLDPGILGLEAASVMSPWVPSRRGGSHFRSSTAVRSNLVETYSNALRRKRTGLLGQVLGRIRPTVVVIPISRLHG